MDNRNFQNKLKRLRRKQKKEENGIKNIINQIKTESWDIVEVCKEQKKRQEVIQIKEKQKEIQKEEEKEQKQITMEEVEETLGRIRNGKAVVGCN